MFKITPTSLSRRRLVASPRRHLVTILILATSALAAHVPAAFAEPGDLTCEAAGQVNFSPPLSATNLTAKVTESVVLFDCTSPNGNYPNLKSGVASGSGTATSSGGLNPCSALITVELDKVTVTWSPTGQKSHGEFLFNTNPSAGPISSSGTVTRGVLAGDPVTFVGATTPNADCAVNGLSSLTAAGEDIFG